MELAPATGQVALDVDTQVRFIVTTATRQTGYDCSPTFRRSPKESCCSAGGQWQQRVWTPAPLSVSWRTRQRRRASSRDTAHKDLSGVISYLIPEAVAQTSVALPASAVRSCVG